MIATWVWNKSCASVRWPYVKQRRSTWNRTSCASGRCAICLRSYVKRGSTVWCHLTAMLPMFLFNISNFHKLISCSHALQAAVDQIQWWRDSLYQTLIGCWHFNNPSCSCYHIKLFFTLRYSCSVPILISIHGNVQLNNISMSLPSTDSLGNPCRGEHHATIKSVIIPTLTFSCKRYTCTYKHVIMNV